VVIDGSLVELLRVGVPAIRTVIKRGVVVHERARTSPTLKGEV
jgi:hypothetical protein